MNPVIVLPENGALVIPVTEAEKYGELAAHISILGEDGVEVVSPGNHIQAQKGQMSPLSLPRTIKIRGNIAFPVAFCAYFPIVAASSHNRSITG